MRHFAARVLLRVRQEIIDMQHGHAVLWDDLGRIDPDPTPFLHWEPTASGWRLYGALAPPERSGSTGPGPGTGPGRSGPD